MWFRLLYASKSWVRTFTVTYSYGIPRLRASHSPREPWFLQNDPLIALSVDHRVDQLAGGLALHNLAEGGR